jgi:hypothetical protein
VAAIARLALGDEDAIRQVIHRFNETGVALHAHLRWRNANARHTDVLAAHRRERARIRSERQRRWGRTAQRPAA